MHIHAVQNSIALSSPILANTSKAGTVLRWEYEYGVLLVSHRDIAIFGQ